MKTNWDKTQNNTNVATANYYYGAAMAEIVLWGGDFVGVLGKWWVPVKHRDTFANRLFKQVAKDLPGSSIRVAFPLPDVEDATPLFEEYVFEGKSAVSAA